MTNTPHKCDCLNHCGDDPWLSTGKAEHCDNYKAAAKAEALIESIHWKLPEDEMPDDDCVVLGFFDDCENEPVWPCFHDADKWRMAEDGFQVDPPKAWSHMPSGPSNTTWMKVRSKS